MSSAPRSRPRPRRSASTTLLRLSPLLLALAEVVVLVLLFKVIGWWAVLGLFALSFLGFLVIGRSSRQAWRDIRQARRTGQEPQRRASDAVITLIGALLLILPGYVSGLLGVLVLLPFTRGLTRRLVSFLAARQLLKVFGVQVQYGAGRSFSGPVVQGETAQTGVGPDGSTAGPGRGSSEQPPQAIEGRIVDPDDPADPGHTSG